jgi:hypothetical protein
VIQEVTNLAVSFSYQCHDRNVRRIVFTHRAEECAFTDSAAAEETDPLALPAWQQAVDRSNASDQGFRDMFAVQGIGWRAKKIVARGFFDRRTGVHRLAESIEDTPEEGWANHDARTFGSGNNRIVGLQSVNLLQRHGENAAVPESDHLRSDAPASESVDLAERANRDRRPL